MRATWSGNLSYQNISFPIKLYPARESGQAVKFNMLHTCGSRVNHQTYCPNCERTIEKEETKRGYEFEKEKYVVMEQEDFDRLPLSTIKQISVMGFIKEGVDPRAIDNAFYLAPDTKKKGVSKKVVRVYQLLHSVMKSKEVRAIGKVAMRDKERLCEITPLDGVFLLRTLCYEEEVRDFRELEPERAELSDDELRLGEQMVDRDTMLFNWGAFHDEYREALEKVIEAKIEGREIAQPSQAEALETGDLVNELLTGLGLEVKSET